MTIPQRFFFLLMLTVTLVMQSIVVSGQNLNRFEFESQHMGTTFQIILYAENDSIAHTSSQKAFATIDSLNNILSDYIPDSELSRLSQASGSGQAFQVSPPLFELLQQSIDISQQTNGWFDVTIGPYTHIWRGLNRMSEPELPSESELEDAASRVGYQNILLDEAGQTVQLLTKNMRLDPGGIGKGFASDKALEALYKYGITRALINAGGDITASDPPLGKSGWSVAVPVRFDEDSVRYEELSIANRAINTSGSLYQSVEIDGTTYSHIINPKTGLGHTEQIQVSVISTNGAEADAFATAPSVMPINEAQALIESKLGLEAVIYWINNSGATERWMSSGVERYLQK